MHADKQFKGCIELLGTLSLFAKENEIPPKIMCSARIDQPPSKKKPQLCPSLSRSESIIDRYNATASKPLVVGSVILQVLFFIVPDGIEHVSVDIELSKTFK